MASFIDQKQREWDIRICAPTIDLVREDDALFLLDDDNRKQNTAARLENDPSLLCHVIYTLCKKQREERGVTLDQFYEDVIGDGDTIAAAAEALAAAIENFTPPRKREFIRAVAEKQKAAENLALAKALAKLNDPTLEAKIEREIDERLANLFPP